MGLTCLDEGYIAYFNERIKIEQTYIDSLNKLHARTVGVDALHDDVTHRGQRSTARGAWLEVRDYTQREVDSREALVNALKEDVVNRLVALRDTETRIRNRIREDLKHATDAYEDYAFSKIPKLKRSYFSKTAAIEDFRKQEAAVAKQSQLLSETSNSPPPDPKPHPFTLPVTNAHAHSSSMSTYSTSGGSSVVGSTVGGPGSDTTPTHTPAPTSPGAGTGYGSLAPPNASLLPKTSDKMSGRARSGSASLAIAVADGRSKEMLQDIAAQGKKGFTSLMQRFGGEAREGGGERELAATQLSPLEMPSPSKHSHAHAQRGSISRSTSIAKGAKLKRDAADANQAYRTGVFHCESLRLRREKLQQSAVTSLLQFNDDLNATLEKTLRAFTDATHGTAATLAQATDVISQAVDDIKRDNDYMVFRSTLPSIMRRTPILYENYYVGPCHSLIFGVSLTDYDFARGEGGDHGRPPAIVEKCIAEVDHRGLAAEGIYRLSGRQQTVKLLIQDIERDEDAFMFSHDEDVYGIGVILKQYLRELPDPLFPLPHAERVKYTEYRESLMESNFAPLRARLRRLPPIHQTTFQAIIEHLARVNARSQENKMDAKNLATVFNAALFGQDQTGGANALTMHLEKDTVLEDLITYSDLLFSAPSPVPEPAPSSVSSQPLPNSSPDRRPSAANTTFDPRPSPERRGSRHTNVSIGPVPVVKELESTASDTVVPSSAAGTANISAGAFQLHVTDDTPANEFTPDEHLTLLYDPAKIPVSFHQAVGDAYHVRPLASDDFLRSHFGLLSHLSQSPALAPSVYTSLFNAMRACDDTYYITVIVSKATDQIVASGTVLKEAKYSHSGGHAGHIEDVVVSPTVQGQGLGKKLVIGILDLATAVGCYKTILDCQEAKVPFYEKCGFTRRGAQMAYYAPSDVPGRAGSAGSYRQMALTPVPTGVDGTAAEPAGGLHDMSAAVGGDDPLVVPHDEHDDAESVAETVETSASGVTYHFPLGALSAIGSVSGSGRTPSSSGTATPLVLPEGAAPPASGV